ncbi:hypothetical protein [Pandoraea iniqua]|uniref:hypothetical protein n=1 Tax=Pandoraea iniqua TaxID=2508288 RepID=UPI001240FA46|nr:hypothetical protein [Pandoraea iniqua]
MIDWIHRVEHDRRTGKISKRLPSIISELFFETVLCKSLEFHLPRNLNFGWNFNRNPKDGSRTWFKFSENTDHPSTSENFIKSIKTININDEFFVVQQRVTITNNIPSIGWKIREISILPEGYVKRYATDRAKDFEKKITQRVTEALLTLRAINTSPGKSTVEDWLRTLPDNTLERLLATRCFMNFAGLFLSDVDALGVDPDGRLVLLEFKRKTPAMGTRYRALRQAGEDGGLDLYLSRIAALGKDREALQRALKDANAWSAIESNPGFGLDTSHVGTFDLCSRADIKYRYVIWNSSGQHPRELLAPDWKPIDDIDLRTADLTGDAFDGLTYTIGGDSGSYTKNVRYQLVIPVDRFAMRSIGSREF